MLSVLMLCAALLPLDDDLALHRQFGFDGLVVSKFNDGLYGLTAGDVDGDGIGDLLVINNSKSRIELLLHGDPEDEGVLELANELPDEIAFERRPVAVEQRVWDATLADLDGDGRDDVVFTGDSGKLNVAWAGADADFEKRGSWPLENGRALRGSIATGDLDADGRLDVVVLTEQAVEILLTDADGAPRAARSLPLVSGDADGFELVDLDGDGRLDLLMIVSGSDWPLRWRLGQGGTEFGPEISGELSSLRAYATADLDADGASEVLVVTQRSGRVQRLDLRTPDVVLGDALQLSAPRQLPFRRLKDSTGREAVLEDLDRDGFPDLLVAEPSSASLVVYRGAPGGQFRPAEAHPSLLGSSHPRVVDLDGDGVAEVVLAAPDEGALALAALDDAGRPGFPQVLGATGGELLAMDVGRVSSVIGDPAQQVWAVVGEGSGRKRKYQLRRWAADGTLVSEELDDVEADPNALLVADLDHDGRDDLMLFIPTEKPILLLPRESDTGWLRVDMDLPGLGLLEGLGRDQLDVVDVDGDGGLELLVPAGNFVRALHLDAEGRPVVVAQVNLADPAAEVGAVTAADLDGDGALEYVMAQKGSQRVLVLDASGRERARVDTGDVPVESISAADLDVDGRADLLLWSRDRVAAVITGRSDPVFVSRDEYESPVKGAYLDALVAGDVNADGSADLIIVETNKHTMHIATLHEGKLEHALKFAVYESRLFESSRRSSREPREVIVADLTADGLSDIAILVHDRLIVYPQEPAP